MGNVLMTRALCIAVFLAVLPGTLPAETHSIGRVVAADGVAEIVRSEATIAARPDVPLHEGDRLRTATDSRMQIELDGDCVLELRANTEVVIEQHEVVPQASHYRSRLALQRGRIQGSIGEQYDRADAQFLIVSPTAHARATGGELVVDFDDRRDATDIIGIRGRVTVHGALDPAGEGVVILARQSTTVAAGQGPAEAATTDTSRFPLLGGDPIAEWKLGTLWSLERFVGGSFLDFHDLRTTVAELEVLSVSQGRQTSVEDGSDVGSLIGQPLEGPGSIIFDVDVGF